MGAQVQPAVPYDDAHRSLHIRMCVCSLSHYAPTGILLEAGLVALAELSCCRYTTQKEDKELWAQMGSRRQPVDDVIVVMIPLCTSRPTQQQNCKLQFTSDGRGH